MKLLLFPIFIFRLAFILAGFIASTIFRLHKKKIQVVIFTLAMILSLTTLFLSRYSKNTKLNFFQQKVIFRQNYLENEKERLLQILVVQPTHKDTLINLSIVSCQLEEWDNCNNYFHQAKKLDPNDPFFAKFSPFGN